MEEKALAAAAAVVVVRGWRSEERDGNGKGSPPFFATIARVRWRPCRAANRAPGRLGGHRLDLRASPVSSSFPIPEHFAAPCLFCVSF